MPAFRDARDLERHLKKALDSLQAEVLITTQSELGSSKISPVDTGRLRSSWFAAEGGASSEVAPEGADSPSTDATGLRVDADKTYHITNSLPYVQSVALEGRVVAKPNNWFIDFMNVRVPTIQAAALGVVKAKFEL